jgi:protein-S-isoprenylcysteine O-methyltransferase Ste14
MILCALLYRSKDRQRATWVDRLALLAFIITVVLLHWRSVIRFVTSTAVLMEGVALYDIIGFSCMALGTLLNRAAAAALGQAWDRVSKPESLVTTGVYALMQHPIYTSYMVGG